ncbi:MAG: YidC/Oxa1 family membrane protein insertase [Candidatus Cloacimonas sp.]|nr:YidC/Oxa1 family membrane protein insertase [Candidatus Cloacimonadota bacterium]
MSTVLYPLMWLLQIAFLSFYKIIGSYGLSLLLLSVATSTIMAWLGVLIQRYPEREALVQRLMAPKLAAIKNEARAEVRHRMTVELYKRYNYHPILALRSAFPLILQLPFLFAAYHMLSNMEALQGVSFWLIKDLALPDGMILGENILPILMTVINILTALLTPGFTKKDKVQTFVIAGLFLALLYNAASALLVYWTTNNLIFFIRTLASRKHAEKVIVEKDKRRSIRELIEYIAPLFKQYFALLSMFYVFQAIALERGLYFSSFLKYIPFFIATLGFALLQVYEIKRSFQRSFRYYVASLIVGISLLTAFLGCLLIIKKHISVREFFNFSSYTLFTSTFIAGIFIRKEKYEEPLETLPRWLLLFIIPLIPAIHYAKVNGEYLMGEYNIYFFIVILLVAFINYMILRSSVDYTRTKSDSILKAAVFTLLFISLPMFRFALRLTSQVDIDFWILAFCTFVLINLINNNKRFTRALQVSSIVLIVFIVSSLVTRSEGSNIGYKRKVLKEEYKSIVLKEKPNIYLFVYDGIPNERVFREQGLPFEELSSMFIEFQFKLYPDTYSLGDASLNSMGNMLDFSNRPIKTPEGRDVYTGNSWVNLILRENGYESRFLLESYYTGYAAITHTDLFDEIYPTRSINAAKLDFFLVLIRGVLQGEMRFDTRGLIALEDVDVQSYKQKVIKEEKESSFVVNHYGLPGHSQNSGKCLPNETELWVEKFESTLELMRSDFETIRDYDPSSIVIAIGDHGPSLTGDCYNLADWKREEITPDLVWDRIGTVA